jgi:ankyrin repeat protein
MKTMDDIRAKYEGEILFMFAKFDDPNELIDGEDALLHVAAGRNDLDVIDALIALGADVNRIGDMRATPLHVACTAGHLEAAMQLVAAGADLTPVNEFGFTATDKAKMYGHEDIIKYLESNSS